MPAQPQHWAAGVQQAAFISSTPSPGQNGHSWAAQGHPGRPQPAQHWAASPWPHQPNPAPLHNTLLQHAQPQGLAQYTLPQHVHAQLHQQPVLQKAAYGNAQAFQPSFQADVGPSGIPPANFSSAQPVMAGAAAAAAPQMSHSSFPAAAWRPGQPPANAYAHQNGGEYVTQSNGDYPHQNGAVKLPQKLGSTGSGNAAELSFIAAHSAYAWANSQGQWAAKEGESVGSYSEQTDVPPPPPPLPS